MERNLIYVKSTHTHRDKMENIDVKLHSQKECERNSTLSGKWQLQNFIGWQLSGILFTYFTISTGWSFFFFLKIQECLHSLKKKTSTSNIMSNISELLTKTVFQ